MIIKNVAMDKFAKSILSGILILFLQHGSAQDSIDRRILLIGDAGKLDNGKHPELELMRKLYDFNDKKTTIIFLGDNVYPYGLPSPYSRNFETEKKILDNQIKVVDSTNTEAYFIPGNHDWLQGGSGGWQRIINQYQYVTSLQLPNVHFVPDNGCPGPVEVPIGERIVLVLIDSQWWLQRYDKPTSGCDCNTEDELLGAIQDIVDRNMDKLLIFASHHPFKTYGRHGGYFNLKQHIFPLTENRPNLWIPLPIIGSLYPISRGIFGNIQDVRHPIYKRYSQQIDTILTQHPYCIRVAGHEHNLQLIKLNNQYYVVSGGGSKISEVSKGPGTEFRAAKTGFAVIETMKNGNVKLSFFSSMNDSVQKPIHTTSLPPLDTVAKKKLFKPGSFPDSVTITGNLHFKAGGFKRFLLGKNYRDEWTEPVRVKVFDIGKEKGGLKPTHRGGGLQSKALQLQDSKGNEYVLRSIEKFPDNTLPEEFRQTFIRDAVVDGISASYPYAALSVPPLSQAAGVPHAQPRLVYVPDDPQLGFFQKDFRNTLSIFEEREPGGFKNTSTEKTLDKLRQDNDNHIDQKAVLKARLFDMFIMDFDRHDDQWRWSTRDTGKGKIYFPIPRDRDQAFFVNMGLIPYIVRKPQFFPKFQGFRPKAININTFNYNARYFDRSFLNELTQDDWKNQVDTLVGNMTDSVIELALRMQPPEVYQYSSAQIVQKLKDRRKYLRQEAIQYYKFLARYVNVVGSDKKELFDVTRNDDGSVLVIVYKINKEGEQSSKMYERKFLQSETREIRLYGQGGNDKFVIKGTGSKTIQVRIIGGSGNDIVENDSKAKPGKLKVYDLRTENNQLTGDGKVSKKLSPDPNINLYDRNEFKYNLSVPGISFSYNIDDGLYLGLTHRYVAQGFRKEPYKFMQRVSANHALATKAYNFKYTLEAIDVFGNTDIVANGILRAPKYTINYFKLGNESVFDKSDGKSIQYYRTRFNEGDFSALLRSELFPDVSWTIGPTFQSFSISRKENLGKIISYPSVIGEDSSRLYKSKTYLGFETGISIDNRNNEILPTRGVNWQTTFRSLKGLGKYSKSFTQLNSDLSVFISSSIAAKFVVALRFGVGINFGSYEFFQAQYLSGTENLRGYRKYRFGGDRLLFNNLELRFKLKEFQTYLFPGAVGLMAFHDIGRVWLKGEISHVWHNGYGGGIWLAPAKRFVVTALYTTSKEGPLPLVTVGFQF